MPVILTSVDEQKRWLQAENLDEILGMLQTPVNDILNMYRVSELLNSVVNNSPALHDQVPEPPTLFG